MTLKDLFPLLSMNWIKMEVILDYDKFTVQWTLFLIFLRLLFVCDKNKWKLNNVHWCHVSTWNDCWRSVFLNVKLSSHSLFIMFLYFSLNMCLVEMKRLVGSVISPIIWTNSLNGILGLNGNKEWLCQCWMILRILIIVVMI